MHLSQNNINHKPLQEGPQIVNNVVHCRKKPHPNVIQILKDNLMDSRKEATLEGSIIKLTT